MKTIILAGRLPGIVNNLTRQLSREDVHFLGATNAAELANHLNNEDVESVIMGGGLEDTVRAELCLMIWQTRDDLPIHIKDRASGPGGMAGFVTGILDGPMGNA